MAAACHKTAMATRETGSTATATKRSETEGVAAIENYGRSDPRARDLTLSQGTTPSMAMLWSVGRRPDPGRRTCFLWGPHGQRGRVNGVVEKGQIVN